mgnify:CR=1 FL=1
MKLRISTITLLGTLIAYLVGMELGDPYHSSVQAKADHNKAVVQAVEAGAHRYSSYQDVNLYPECAGPRMSLAERDSQLR